MCTDQPLPHIFTSPLSLSLSLFFPPPQLYMYQLTYSVRWRTSRLMGCVTGISNLRSSFSTHETGSYLETAILAGRVVRVFSRGVVLGGKVLLWGEKM